MAAHTCDRDPDGDACHGRRTCRCVAGRDVPRCETPSSVPITALDVCHPRVVPAWNVARPVPMGTWLEPHGRSCGGLSMLPLSTVSELAAGGAVGSFDELYLRGCSVAFSSA